MSQPIPAGTFVTKVLRDFMRTSGLEPTLLGANHLRILNARPGQVNLELVINKQHTNRLNILHGGTMASLVDLGGSLAVASMGFFNTGVSTDLNVTYIKSGGQAGDKIRVLAELDKMGKTLAFTTIKFFDDKDALVARGSHTKYISNAVKAQPSPYTVPVTINSESDGPTKSWSGDPSSS